MIQLCSWRQFEGEQRFQVTNIIQLIYWKATQSEDMQKNYHSERHWSASASRSFSNWLNQNIQPLQLRKNWLRKSLFNPQEGLAQSYATRNHIAGADVPIIEVLYSSQRWLLLQTPRFSPSFFKKLNFGLLGNPYQALMRIFKSFAALASIYGFFRPTPGMIFVIGREICVWINEDIFSNKVRMPLKSGRDGEIEFVLSFLAMVQTEMKEWQRVVNMFTIDETVKLLEWRSKLRRGSLTALKASKHVFHIPHESTTSFEPNELKFYQSRIKGCMSVQDGNGRQSLNSFNEDLSSSNIKYEEKRIIPMKINKSRLYDQKDMTNSVHDQIKQPETAQDVQKTKKKFNLTSTSSTLERFSEKLNTTVGRKVVRLQKPEKQVETHKQQPLNARPSGSQHRAHTMHKSEPISIANELQGLFVDENNEIQLGIQGNHQQLEKIAQEMQEVLIW